LVKPRLAFVKKNASAKSVEPRTRAGPRRRPKPEVREETILHAASLEFCEKGYDAATISDIAKRAGIADGTIYKYVSDKRELLFRVLSKSIEGHVNQTIEGALALATAREKIEYFCYRHLLFWEQNPELSILYAAESRTRDQHHWPTYRENNRRYVRVVQDALEEGLAKGEFEFSAPPKFLRDILIGSVEQVAWGFSSSQQAIDPHRMAKEIMSIFMRGLTSRPDVADQEGDRIARLERAIERMEQLGSQGLDS
jgi:AcrR family transcriptional regulator